MNSESDVDLDDADDDAEATSTDATDAETTSTDAADAEATTAASETTDGAAGTDTELGRADPAEDACELRAEELAIGYPTTDEPVVEVEKLVIPAGEVTALVGPNGSGKSTLLRTLAGQMDAERGTIVLDGEEIETFGTKALARKLGLLSQENQSPGSITVEELVYHGRYPHRSFFDSPSDDDAAAVDRAIDLAGVGHLRDQEVGNLSGGQKQLVWIAMVLAQETDVLLLDEPTTFLDLRHQLRVMEVVRELNRERGVTVAVVLHDIGQAARFADNLVAMKDGTPYDWGPPRKVVDEALLREVFGVEADVDADHPTGPHISPHRALDE